MDLQLAEYPAFPDGISQDAAQNAIPDSYAWFIQDGLLHVTGQLRQRGPLNAAATLTTGARPHGMVSMLNSAGLARIAVLVGTNAATATLNVFDENLASPVELQWADTFAHAEPYRIFDAKPALNGGVLISTAKGYGMSADTRVMRLWKGAAKTNYSAGTINAVAYGDTTINFTGSSLLANVEPGMFLYKTTVGDNLIGTVKRVVSNTQLILEQGAITTTALGNSYILVSSRPLGLRITTGRITVASGATTVNGGDTKFVDENVGATHKLFRQNDMRYIGTVTSVASNIQLTLAAGATAGMTNEHYVMIPTTTISLLSTVAGNAPPTGFLHANWGGYQFYANRNIVSKDITETSTVFFSDALDIEGIDLSATGSFLRLPMRQTGGDAIIGLAATETALLIFREDDTHILMGTSPDDWVIRPLADDGLLSPMAISAYKGGVLWAGKRGIYRYDGVQAENILVGRISKSYAKALVGMDINENRSWSQIVEDHFMLYTDSFELQSRPVESGLSVFRVYTIATNLVTGAITLLTNMQFRGTATYPRQKWVLHVLQTGEFGTYTPKVAFANDLFDPNAGGTDEFTCTGSNHGPDFYLETKLYDVGNSQRKKLFKQVQFTYSGAVNFMQLDVLQGLSRTTTTSPVFFDQVGNAWATKRFKFLKRDRHIGFRVYKTANAGIETLSRFIVSSWGIAFKPQRVGRV